jgi:3alpha(or 20beta)-hydroxysteroid dehydrogenase
MGAATARLFAREGARVVIADVLESEGAIVAGEIGAAAAFRKLDVTNEDAWRRVVADTQQRWDQIDILVNNAGVVHAASITELEQKDFERVLNINLIGAWLGIKTIAPLMMTPRKGVIVNICSTAGLWGMNGLTAYSASKWALRGLTKTAAMELGLRGVRVNAIFPGGINTPMGNITNEPASELNKYYQRQPIRRIGEPDEVARTTLFLVSDDASYLCGAEIAVDGGQALGVYNDFLPAAPSTQG